MKTWCLVKTYFLVKTWFLVKISFFDLKKKKKNCGFFCLFSDFGFFKFFWIFYVVVVFFGGGGFLSKLLRLLLKVTIVTTGHQNCQKWALSSSNY